MIARSWQANDDGSVDIYGISQYVTLPGPPYHVRALVLAKAAITLGEAERTFPLTMRITRTDDGAQYEQSAAYPAPDVLRLANTDQYIEFRLDMQMTAAGEHLIEITVGGVAKAAETLVIVGI